jgi:hypothetical protein
VLKSIGVEIRRCHSEASSGCSDPERKLVVHRLSEILLAAKMAFGRQHGGMPQQELNLLLPTTVMTQLRTGPSPMPHTAWATLHYAASHTMPNRT